MHGALIVETMLVLSVVYLLIFLHLKLLATVYVVMFVRRFINVIIPLYFVSGNKKKMDSSFRAFTFLLQKQKKNPLSKKRK